MRNRRLREFRQVCTSLLDVTDQEDAPYVRFSYKSTLASKPRETSFRYELQVDNLVYPGSENLPEGAE